MHVPIEPASLNTNEVVFFARIRVSKLSLHESLLYEISEIFVMTKFPSKEFSICKVIDPDVMLNESQDNPLLLEIEHFWITIVPEFDKPR